MRFQLWGNSNTHIQLFEPIATGNECDRAFRLFAVDYEDGKYTDGIICGYSSQLHHSEHDFNTPLHDIEKAVDETNNTQPSEQAAG